MTLYADRIRQIIFTILIRRVLIFPMNLSWTNPPRQWQDRSSGRGGNSWGWSDKGMESEASAEEEEKTTDIKIDPSIDATLLWFPYQPRIADLPGVFHRF